MKVRVAALAILIAVTTYVASVSQAVYASEAVPSSKVAKAEPLAKASLPGPRLSKADQHDHVGDTHGLPGWQLRPVASMSGYCTICVCSYTSHWLWCAMGSPAGFLCLTYDGGIHTCNNYIPD